MGEWYTPVGWALIIIGVAALIWVWSDWRRERRRLRTTPRYVRKPRIKR